MATIVEVVEDGETFSALLTEDVDTTATPTPFPVDGSRFFTGYEWRFIFTDLDCATTTFAEGLLRSRKFVKALGEASVIEADVVPDDDRVNHIHTDGYPRVAPNKRLMFGFRREGAGPGSGGAPWRVRAAGIVMTDGDEGDVDVPLTHVTAYDPRKLLEARPVMNLDGELPSALGFNYLARSGSSIAVEMLQATILSDGGVFIDAGPDFGGTFLWEGTIEDTAVVEFNAQQGMMVAEAWSQLEQTGTMEIVLTPIYDPLRRPGFTHDLTIRSMVGAVRHNAVFGWDRMQNNVARIERLHDGTPGAFSNKVWYHAGQGGPGIPLTGPSTASGTINAASVADFGVYWNQQFFPSQNSTDPTGAAVLALAKQVLKLQKQGKRTLTINPIPERAKVPLIEYDIGDRVPLYASKRLRVVSEGLQRVQSIPFDITDDGLENVAGIVTSPDFVGSE